MFCYFLFTKGLQLSLYSCLCLVAEENQDFNGGSRSGTEAGGQAEPKGRCLGHQDVGFLHGRK